MQWIFKEDDDEEGDEDRRTRRGRGGDSSEPDRGSDLYPADRTRGASKLH